MNDEAEAELDIINSPALNAKAIPDPDDTFNVLVLEPSYVYKSVPSIVPVWDTPLLNFKINLLATLSEIIDLSA